MHGGHRAGGRHHAGAAGGVRAHRHDAGGITGRLYQQFALTISIATVFTSINALTLSPALCGMLLRPTRHEKRGWFFTAFNEAFDVDDQRLHGAWWQVCVRRPALVDGGVRRPAGRDWYCGFGQLPAGFLPDEDQGYFFVNVAAARRGLAGAHRGR